MLTVRPTCIYSGIFIPVVHGSLLESLPASSNHESWSHHGLQTNHWIPGPPMCVSIYSNLESFVGRARRDSDMGQDLHSDIHTAWDPGEGASRFDI